MHNPLAELSAQLLDAMIREGQYFFVRQSYPRGLDHFAGLKGVFLFSHYKDRGQAEKHLNSLNDAYAAFYDATQAEDKAKLYIAAGQPAGYKVYAALLKARKWEPTPQIGPKIKQYIRQHTQWKPERGDNVKVELYIQFGELFLNLKKGAEEIKVPLNDIEKY